MKKLALLLLTTLALSNYSFAEVPKTDASVSASEENTKQATIPSVAIDDTMDIDATTKHEEDSQLPYQIDYSYPQITGDNLSPAALKFNQLVLDAVNKNVLQFKNYVKADMLHMQTLPDSLKHNSLRIDYKIDVLKPAKQTLISLRISIEGMQAGRAHPYHKHEMLNYDLTKGTVLTLKDLFKPRVNYLAVFSKVASAELNKKLQDKWMIKDGTAPLAKNYQLWNLNNKGIAIMFEEYQVAPYVYGAQEIEVPYSAIKNLLALNAPIASCAKDIKGCEK